MSRIRFISVIIGAILWAGFLLWMGNLIFRIPVVTTGKIPAVPWLPSIALGIIVGTVIILFSKKRLTALCFISLFMGSILVLFWISSFRANLTTQYLPPNRIVSINGNTYDSKKSLIMRLSLGGLGIEYESWLYSHDPGTSFENRAYFGAVKARGGDALQYPGWGNGGEFKPIPRWGGFDSAFLAASTPTSQMQAMYALVVPLWFVMLFCFIFPSLWLRKIAKERRRKRLDLCICGYSLVGTPADLDGTRRCSEYGRINPAPKSATTGIPKPANGITDPSTTGESKHSAAETQEMP